MLADHIRAISFTIADGQLPSNTGAGYVIRRILRRAVRYYYSYLDYKQPLLHQLVSVLAHQFENVFPELQQQTDFVGKVIREEEEAFLRTLDKGLKRIESIITNSRATGEIDGKSAFELNDTYGFPIDLTKLIAAENKLSVDEAGYETEREKQQERGRAAAASTRKTGSPLLISAVTVLWDTIPWKPGPASSGTARSAAGERIPISWCWIPLPFMPKAAGR